MKRIKLHVFMIYGLGAYGLGDLIQTHLYVEGF